MAHATVKDKFNKQVWYGWRLDPRELVTEGCKFGKFDPNPIGTLHAQVCKFGHQWKYSSSIIMQLCNHASSLDSADVINETH